MSHAGTAALLIIGAIAAVVGLAIWAGWAATRRDSRTGHHRRWP